MVRIVGLQDEARVVDELAEVLQRLEDVLTRSRALAFHFRLDPTRIAVLLVQLALERREVAVVVLDDLRWQVVKDVLLKAAQEEGQDLLVQGFER